MSVADAYARFMHACRRDTNNENTLVLRSQEVADRFAGYIRGEVDRLVELGRYAKDTDVCRCSDGVDNDGDGLADANDSDCDMDVDTPSM